MLNLKEIRDQYPLHYYIWVQDCEELKKILQDNQVDKEKKDVRGRTPLMLAVTLNFLEIVRILLSFDCNVNSENDDNWSVVQEAVATGNRELLHVILQKRQLERHSNRSSGIPQLLQKLKDTPDFYVEMRWEFSSWVPLVTKMCPSDTYKVYKQGSTVRIDTTLMDFDLQNIQRGNRTFVFKGQDNQTAIMLDIDHDQRQVYTEKMHNIPLEVMKVFASSEEAISQRLNTPIVNTYVDFERITFERCKSGILGFGSDRVETINGYTCKVFSATNVELITKSRTDHLFNSNLEPMVSSSSSTSSTLKNMFGIQVTGNDISDNNNAQDTNNSVSLKNRTKHNVYKSITIEEYFDENCTKDIGCPKIINTKVEKYKANLWLCENYPLSLPEQIIPIVDIMAISVSHFARLKDFIQMQLPSGFPIKIEIPLFHVLTANVTFCNIFAMENPIPNVSIINEDNRISCIIDENCFRVSSSYTEIGFGDTQQRRQFTIDDEDDLLQFAIQKSLLDVGTEDDQVDIWEALKSEKPISRNLSPMRLTEEEQLQRAIQASLLAAHEQISIRSAQISDQVDDSDNNNIDDDLKQALLLSEQQQKTDEQIRQSQDEELLEKVLKLSLVEKVINNHNYKVQKSSNV